MLTPPPAPLRGIVRELAGRALPLARCRQAEALAGLTAVDGSIFAAQPRMAWALWKDDVHRGVRLHLHFDVLKAVPADAAVTPAACSERAALAAVLQPGRLYVLDRGYADHGLFARIVAAGSSVGSHGSRTMSPTPCRKSGPSRPPPGRPGWSATRCSRGWARRITRTT